MLHVGLYFTLSAFAIAIAVYMLTQVAAVALASIVLAHGLIKASVLGQLLFTHFWFLHQGLTTYDYVMEQREIIKAEALHHDGSLSRADFSRRVQEIRDAHRTGTVRRESSIIVRRRVSLADLEVKDEAIKGVQIPSGSDS